MSFKQDVYTRCRALLNDKIKSLRAILAELEEGSQNDSKSSAGDKHETARSMMQLEQEKTGRQLREAIAQKTALEKIGLTAPSSIVKEGSLLETNQGVLFLCVSIGKINVGAKTIMVISARSPLGVKLIGLKANNTVHVNDKSYTVVSIA